MSVYLGSNGFGLPAAMGAWAAVHGTRPVVAVAGDGGLGQCPLELTAAVKYRMDITLVVLDNGELGRISKEQRAADLDVWQTSLRNPPFAGFAESCGALGIRVGAADELRGALEGALAHVGPSVVHVVTDPLLV
jgi:thiamine pyrophosphate-dependent acetolactate synthase large subunit-like protein